jgi:hypothetical protein
VSGWVWFILGALWVAGIWLAWNFMRGATRKPNPDRMSDEWLERRRKEDGR